MKTINVNIPFPGFYESLYSDGIDQEETRDAEYYESDRQLEEGIPPELRLSADEYGEILQRHTDYSSAYLDVARAYVDGFNAWAQERVGFDLGLTFETMSSPREYNFTTDRIFCDMPWRRVLRLAAISRRDNHKTLARVIRERFTSRSGFSAFYSNDLEDWLEKPLAKWDHNELGTLLIAATGFSRDDDSDMEIYYIVSEDTHFWEAWQNAVDWEKVEADVAELRNEKREALRAADPDWVEPAPRCPLTPDLFAAHA